MIVVIQCAGAKHSDAGFLRRGDGKRVKFVAHPEWAPTDPDCAYAHPDDIADTGRSWRDELRNYNDSPRGNPLGLLPAWRLYRNRTYELLAERLGSDRLFILSAGWGLIRADFLTPQYDITFSSSADRYKRRFKRDCYQDLRMLPEETEGPIVFFVGKAYQSLAMELTRGTEAEKWLFYNSKAAPEAPGCSVRRYLTKIRTNWQYCCARDFIDGRVGIDG